MAARNLAPVRAINRELVPVVGSFAPNGSSAVDEDDNIGLGWSVARDDVGIFIVTLSDKWSALVSAQAQLQLESGGIDSWFATVSDVDLDAGTIEIRIVDEAGAETDVAADAQNRIHFTFWLSNTSTFPTKGT